MRRCELTTPVLLLTAWAATAAAANEPVPYGHADFYPAPQRPAGLQGDGSGQFPGATPVTEWDFRTGRNIIWRAMLPNWGYSSPIVVGDKVFVTTDWNKLICLDARDGRTLWQRDNWTFDIVAKDAAEAKQLRDAWDRLVGEHSKAWACCWEISYLGWKLAVIKAAKSGEPCAWPKSGCGGYAGDHGKGEHIAAAHVTDAEARGVLAQLKGTPDQQVRQIEKRLEQLKKLRGDNDWAPEVNGYVPTLCPYRRGSDKAGEWRKTVSECYGKLLMPHGVFSDMWNGWLGTSFATPVSDGKCVWALFGQSQVVCYDLDGNRRWIRVCLEADRRKVSWRTAQNFSASPILVGDKLIAVFGGSDHGGTTVRAFHKATGEVLWERPAVLTHGGHSGHPFWQVRRMNCRGVDALVVGNGMILAGDDGRVIVEGLCGLVAPPLVCEDRAFYISGNGECGNGKRYGVQLVRENGRTMARLLWGVAAPGSRGGEASHESMKKLLPDSRITVQSEGAPRGSEVGCLFVHGRIVLGSDPSVVLDPSTGRETVLPTAGSSRYRVRPRGHLIRAGDHLIAEGGDGRVAFYDPGNPAKVTAVNPTGSDWQRRVQLLQMPPDEVVQAILQRHFLPYYTSWSMAQTTPWPQGDRLYVRTRDTLYCIGDPARAYRSPRPAAHR